MAEVAVGNVVSVLAEVRDLARSLIEGHLDNPIRECWNPQATLAAIALGNQPLSDRQRPERPRPQLLP